MEHLVLWQWLLLALAVIVIGVAKSGFGGGVGIVAVPMFVIAAGDSQKAIGLMLPLLILADVFSVGHHWKKWDNHNMKLLSVGTFVGIAAGSLCLAWFNSIDTGEKWMRFSIGWICVFYVVADQVRRRWAPNWSLSANWVTGSIAGLLVGITSTLAHAAGPVAAIYFLGQHLKKNLFIGTTVFFFFFVNTIKLIPYGILGLIDSNSLLQGLMLAPLVPVGTYLGAILNRKMSETVFRTIILVIVLITGVRMVMQSWPG